MRLILLVVVAAWSFAADIPVPTDQAMTVCVPSRTDPHAIVSVTLHADDTMDVVSITVGSHRSPIGALRVHAARQAIVDQSSTWAPSTEPCGGAGYQNVSVSYGLGGHTLSLTWAWNEAKGIAMPPQAKIIAATVEDLLRDDAKPAETPTPAAPRPR